MGFRELRKNHPIEEFDYQLLLSNLEEYKNKRDKITRLMRDEKIIRIKKGLYIFGPDYRKSLVSKESLANLIYGPSYISYEYALSFYGMIPERVEMVTSATTGKSRRFATPIGSFSYRHISNERYPVGVLLKQLDEYHSVFIATPEKALIDQVFATKNLTRDLDLDDYFYEDLRIDEVSLQKLSLDHLKEIRDLYSSPRVNRVVRHIEELQNE